MIKKTIAYFDYIEARDLGIMLEITLIKHYDGTFEGHVVVEENHNIVFYSDEDNLPNAIAARKFINDALDEGEFRGMSKESLKRKSITKPLLSVIIILFPSELTVVVAVNPAATLSSGNVTFASCPVVSIL